LCALARQPGSPIAEQGTAYLALGQRNVDAITAMEAPLPREEHGQVANFHGSPSWEMPRNATGVVMVASQF